MPVSLVLMMASLSNQWPETMRAEEGERYFDFWKFSNKQPKQESITSPPTEPTPLRWMNEPKLFDNSAKLAQPSGLGSFVQLLEGTSTPHRDALNDPWMPKGLYRDPDRWRYRLDNKDSLYRLQTKIEVPNPGGVGSPLLGRDWYAEEKLHIPVPLTLPVADQVFMFGNFYGAGDSLNNQQTSVSGKTGIGMKWSLIGTDVQLRYATIFAYADMYRSTRFTERTLPTVEVLANRSLIGPLQIEYMGTAVPALTPSERDQFRQELRFALPFQGENELEFGARYRWEYGPGALPWADRAQLFFGLKFRH
jgi:hypothetical protein